MLFLTFSKANIWFAKQELVRKTYIVAKTIQITRRVEIINKKEFAVAVLNIDNEPFVMHIVTLVEPTTMPIYPSCQA